MEELEKIDFYSPQEWDEDPVSDEEFFKGINRDKEGLEITSIDITVYYAKNGEESFATKEAMDFETAQENLGKLEQYIKRISAN